MIRRFARPYAKAILELTGSPQAAQKVVEELRRFEAARAGSRELSEMFANPGIDASNRLAIAKTIAGRLSLSDLGLRVIDLLVRNHRINDLSSVIETLRAMVNRELGIAVAQVRTAKTLDEKETAELKTALEGKLGQKVELQLLTDPSILGGFVATVGSEVYDASVSGKINKFRKQLSNT